MVIQRTWCGRPTHVTTQQTLAAGVFVRCDLFISVAMQFGVRGACGGLNDNVSPRPIKTGAIRRCDPAEVAVALLEEVCHGDGL